MSLKINNLEKDGDQTKEYILLEATQDVNIGCYAIVDRTFNNKGHISNVHKHFYRFPSKDVKKGEFVSLRTGKGKDTVGDIGGTPLHRFFWGSDAALWNDSEVEKAELLKVDTIASKSV
jgi:hypothetical protein